MMTPEIDDSQLSAFFDGELELSRQLDMERRLSHDAELTTRVAHLRALRQALIGHADYHLAPAELRARLPVLGAAAARSGLHRSGLIATVQRWFAWRPLLSSFGALALLAIALNMTSMQSGQQERLVQEVIASHVRASLTQHMVDVASSDHHLVKPWLSSRLDFSPTIPELNIAGLTFLGGRVDYLDKRPVAVLLYRQGQHVVSSFVWPSSGADSSAIVSAQRGFQIAHWTHDSMDHWVISDLNRQEFMTFIRGLEWVDRKR
jgi:anti-sigma factor RsiW